MNAELFARLRFLLHCVNANAVGPFAPGQLRVTHIEASGRMRMSFRFLGWNFLPDQPYTAAEFTEQEFAAAVVENEALPLI